ncbi:uncharacterized protein A4U43_C07F27670 [Asparagus officinalis]|uniref:Phytocyanin domain-containing protein n=1 Tax=Asparagus officinalis TaxID=4686 RepID=A0A5P1EII2_ASPOF|nr:uncharacterized protein A4U43_C07F27670 [Asparagus officinalis]
MINGSILNRSSCGESQFHKGWRDESARTGNKEELAGKDDIDDEEEEEEEGRKVSEDAVFIYVKGQHNVYQVTEETYRSCNSSSGVKAIHDSGNDRVTLTEATQYWFICDTKGHCKGGMRFGIIVENSTVAKMPSAPSPDDFMPPAPAGNGAGRGRSWWVLGVLFGLFLVA